MSWYIGTLEDCEDYNEKIKSERNYTGNFTSDWDTPVKHPRRDEYAISAHATQPDSSSGLVFVEQLPEDWHEEP